MAKAAQSLSAKDFRDPLLKVLATHIKFDSGRTVKAEDLYGPIYKLMGINPDDYGETGGVLWVQKWIQWAFQALRDDGLGVKHGRGTWGLTPDGVDQARDMAMSATQNTEDQELDDLANIIAGAMVAIDTPNNGMYHPDPYICKLGLGNHNCMGFFADQSPLCVKCPARVLCQEHILAKMAYMAEELARDDLAGQPLKQTSNPQASAVPILSLKFQPPAGSKINPQISSGSAICDQCGGTIKDGDPSIWVRSPLTKKTSMMFHEACCEV